MRILDCISNLIPYIMFYSFPHTTNTHKHHTERIVGKSELHSRTHYHNPMLRTIIHIDRSRQSQLPRPSRLQFKPYHTTDYVAHRLHAMANRIAYLADLRCNLQSQSIHNRVVQGWRWVEVKQIVVAIYILLRRVGHNGRFIGIEGQPVREHRLSLTCHASCSHFATYSQVLAVWRRC